MMRAKTIPLSKRRVSFMLLAALLCLALTGCGSSPSLPKTDMSLVANPSEEAISPSDEAPQSSATHAQPTASSTPAPPRRQLLLTADAITTDPVRLEVLASMVDARSQSEVFPDYSRLFAAFDEESRLSLLLLADEMVYGGKIPSQPLPLEGTKGQVYYDANNHSYHIPDRPLTEEENLMLLDWEMQANHQLLTDALHRLNSEDMAETEEGLVNRAIRLLQGTYNIALGDLEYHLRSLPYGEDEIWQLQFFHSKAHSLTNDGQPCEWYLVEFFASDGSFHRLSRGYTDLAAATGVDASPAPLPLSNATLDSLRQDDYWAQDVREIVEELIQPLSPIRDIYLNRFDGSDLLILRAAMEDGSSYRFNYSLLSRLPSEIKSLTAQELPLPLDPLAPLPSPTASDESIDVDPKAAQENGGESPTPNATPTPVPPASGNSNHDENAPLSNEEA